MGISYLCNPDRGLDLNELAQAAARMFIKEEGN